MDVQERRYQVFISSTFRDLQEERQKVLEAVLESRAFPAGMEMFPSADDEQWEFIKREIDSSDYYVLVVAGKYGSLSPEGISYTQKEYEYAVAAKKPVLSFLFKDLDELKGSMLETDQAKREHVLRFREKVAAGRLVRFYKNPDELKAQVLQSLTYAFNFKPQEGWVRARHSRRLEDLEQITELQTQVRKLEAENAALRSSGDLTSALAQGDDVVEWSLCLTSLTDKNGSITPPLERLTITATWDQVFVHLFRSGRPIGTIRLASLIAEFLSAKVLAQYPSANEWTRYAQVTDYFLGDEYEDLVDAIRVQFQGLGLITVSGEFSNSSERWSLTEEGKVRCALLAGQRKA